jgi:hypothetical protein
MGLFKWLNIDNESAFSRELRALCAKKSGMVLNSPEFVGAFNLRGQLDFQALCRATASQGFNVLMGGPFEDLTGMVGEQQLLNKMVSDFGEFDLIFIQLLLVPKGVEITSKNVMEHPGCYQSRPKCRDAARSAALRVRRKSLLTLTKLLPIIIVND